MPYQAGNRLPGERASKTAHLDVLNNPLVKKLVESFRNPEMPDECKSLTWEPLPDSAEPLKYIFGLDGSYQTVNSDKSPYSVLHQLDQKIIYPHYDFKHLTEKYFEIGMKLNDFSIQLVKY